MDSTMSYEINGPGGGTSSPGLKEDTLLSSDVGPTPSAGESPARNKVPVVGKPESAGIIQTVFYEDSIKGNPGTLDGTLSDILEISFNS